MNFLENLYYGNIQPYELPPYNSEKYQTALKIFAECEEELKKYFQATKKLYF